MLITFAIIGALTVMGLSTLGLWFLCEGLDVMIRRTERNRLYQ